MYHMTQNHLMDWWSIFKIVLGHMVFLKYIMMETRMELKARNGFDVIAISSMWTSENSYILNHLIIEQIIWFKKQNIPDGKTRSRMSNTKKALSKDNICRIFLIFWYYYTSYFIKYGYGKGTHEFHLIFNFRKNVLNTPKLLNDKHIIIIIIIIATIKGSAPVLNSLMEYLLRA